MRCAIAYTNAMTPNTTTTTTTTTTLGYIYTSVAFFSLYSVVLLYLRLYYYKCRYCVVDPCRLLLAVLELLFLHRPTFSSLTK